MASTVEGIGPIRERLHLRHGDNGYTGRDGSTVLRGKDEGTGRAGTASIRMYGAGERGSTGSLGTGSASLYESFFLKPRSGAHRL